MYWPASDLPIPKASLPHCFPSSLFLSIIPLHLRCALSLPPADDRIGSCIIPPCWVIGICLRLFLFNIEASPAAVHSPLSVCVLLGSFSLTDSIVVQFFKFLLIVFFLAPPTRAWEARGNVFVFIQKLSVLAVDIHGAVRLWSVGHQHQGAAARGAVEEALRTAVGQVVPQVRVR